MQRRSLTGATLFRFVAFLSVSTSFCHLQADPAATHGPSGHSVVSEPELRRQAASLEQAGRTLEAARVYEQIVRMDPSRSRVLARRLAVIYAEARQEKKALSWAGIAAKDDPDPNAYLAGINSLMGNQDEAARLLEAELRQTGNAHRKVTLYWQLAGVKERGGDREGAARALNDALGASRGTPDEAVALQKKAAFGAAK